MARRRSPDRAESDRTLEAVLIQPSIPQTLIWDTNQSSIRFKQLVELSERALQERTNAHLLVWPEAAVPNMLRYDLETYQAVTNLAISRNVWMILGSDDAMPRPDSAPGENREYDIYNSSFLVSPRGELVAAYRKRALVIFGEVHPARTLVAIHEVSYAGRRQLHSRTTTDAFLHSGAWRQGLCPDLL